MRNLTRVLWPRRVWKRLLVVAAGSLLVAIVGLATTVSLRWDRAFAYPVQEVTVAITSENIARGEYLYKTVSVCGACHSAGGEENPDLLPTGGREFNIRELGTIFTPNITPALETGIGRWSDGEVIRAIREGVDRDDRFLVLMPSEEFVGMSDSDVQAIVAYLRSLDPVENETDDFQPSVMGRVLLSFFASPPDPITGAVIAPPRGPTAEYGEYLANSVSPCAACHTPRVRGSIDKDRLWSGGEGFDVGDNTIYADNLTLDVETGIGGWTQEDFFRAIRTGRNPQGQPLLLPMPWPQLRNMLDDDLLAIWLHIKTIEPIRNEVPEHVIR